MNTKELFYREYANNFWNDLTCTLWNSGASFDYLPIVFADADDKNRPSKTIRGVTHTHINGKTKLATVFPVIYLDDASDNQIMATIRHETIHYFLAIQYGTHADDSALFWLVCDLFDGRAYEPLKDASQEIYSLSSPFFRQIFQIYQELPNNSVALNISCMLTAVDDAESSQLPVDLEKLKTQLSTCLNAAKKKRMKN